MGDEPVRRRVVSVDLLRGVIIVLMALDHTRDFFHYQAVDPTDLAHTTVPLFATRWVTHFCAPVFMLLAGVGTHLGLAAGKSRREMSWFLVTRGLWLVVLELTVIRCFGWLFNFDYHLTLFLVIWALGWSMVVLAGLIWIPRRVLAAICLIAIAGHNALDGYEPSGSLGWLWTILHAPGGLMPSPGFFIAVPYVLVPWMFVMALGYCIGPVFEWEPARRRRALVVAGLAAIALFVVIRVTNLYGDPEPWISQPSGVFTLLSFLNCTKYPPSLLYLLMTLGPACLLLAAFEHWRGRLAGVFHVFGRVPMVFYLLHLPAIHLGAVVLAQIQFHHIGFMFDNPQGPGPPAPPGYGVPLWAVYLVWAGIVAALYPVCRRYAEYKRTHRSPWLSYL